MPPTEPAPAPDFADELEQLRHDTTARLDAIDAALADVVRALQGRGTLVARMLRVAADAAENPKPPPPPEPTR